MELESQQKRQRQRRRERDERRFDGIGKRRRASSSTSSSAFRLPRLWDQPQHPPGSHALSRRRRRRRRRVCSRDSHGDSRAALLEGRARREGPRRRRRGNPGRAAARVFVPLLGGSRLRRADASGDPGGRSADAGVPFPCSSSSSGCRSFRSRALCKLPSVFFDDDDDAGVEESAERSSSCFRSCCPCCL